jgi:hypothetical protein
MTKRDAVEILMQAHSDLMFDTAEFRKVAERIVTDYGTERYCEGCDDGANTVMA